MFITVIRLTIVATFSLVILCSCKVSTEANNSKYIKEEAVDDTSRINITDAFQEYPYQLKKQPRLSPPDSLAKLGISGSVVYVYTLNTQGAISNVEVMKLRLQNRKGERVADFFDPAVSVGNRDEPYPESVEKHLSWLLSFARSLEFQKIEGIEVQDTTRFTLPIRIK